MCQREGDKRRRGGRSPRRRARDRGRDRDCGRRQAALRPRTHHRPWYQPTKSTGANGVTFNVKPTAAGDLVIRADACLGTDPIPVLAAPDTRGGPSPSTLDASIAEELDLARIAVSQTGPRESAAAQVDGFDPAKPSVRLLAWHDFRVDGRTAFRLCAVRTLDMFARFRSELQATLSRTIALVLVASVSPRSQEAGALQVMPRGATGIQRVSRNMSRTAQI